MLGGCGRWTRSLGLAGFIVLGGMLTALSSHGAENNPPSGDAAILSPEARLEKLFDGACILTETWWNASPNWRSKCFAHSTTRNDRCAEASTSSSRMPNRKRPPATWWEPSRSPELQSRIGRRCFSRRKIASHSTNPEPACRSICSSSTRHHHSPGCLTRPMSTGCDSV